MLKGLKSTGVAKRSLWVRNPVITLAIARDSIKAMTSPVFL
jgi:hypothetical protein